MAHITFIHGIENKPAADKLLKMWLNALKENRGIDLEPSGVKTSMVYWADVLYPSPIDDDTSEAVASSDDTANAIETLAEVAMNPNEARFLAGVAGKLTVASLKAPAPPSLGDQELVPLPWFIKRPAMELFLRDVHHYLFNKEFSPRPGETYRVQDEIRKRFIKSLNDSASRSGPHIVVSHSMGTVIAYDCLKRVSACPRIDGLLTIGSPLGLDEIQDQMQPEWTRRNGFPERTLGGQWFNVFDPLDPVAGFDPYLANDYRLADRRIVHDILESNSGWWRHDIKKYLNGSKLRNAIRQLLSMPVEEFPESIGPAQVISDTGESIQSDSVGFVRYQTIESMMRAPATSRLKGRLKKSDQDRQESMQSRAFEAPDPAAAARLAESLQEIHSEAQEGGFEVMTSPMHREAALLQSLVERLQAETSPDLTNEFPFDGQDTKKTLKKFFDANKNITRHKMLEPESDKPSALSDNAKIFLVSDFGTGLYGAPEIAKAIANKKFDLLMHLGDIYYSGQIDEVRKRFLDIWPIQSGKVSRTLNGNHDMYSGGYGYFDVALPAFNQSSSYFAYQNKHWLLLMLDTAYEDNNIGSTQLAWIKRVMSKAGDRRVILFSHHPLYSNFKSPGKDLAERLGPYLTSGRITAWYWGHEHHAVIYDAHPQYGFYGRCLGNGGMPAKRKDISDYEVERKVGEVSWRRHNSVLTPSALYLDGPNPLIEEEPGKYIPHGYMTLKFDGDSLLEKVHTADGTIVYENELQSSHDD